MFKLMKKSEYELLSDIKIDYERKSNEWKEMQQKLTEKEKFVYKLKKKMQGVGAVIYDIKKTGRVMILLYVSKIVVNRI